MSEIGIITTTESGVDLAIEWKIENFFNLPEEDGAWYWSPTFSFGGEEWFLRIWPNGWRECDSSGHMDLRLYKRSTDCSIKQSFSFSLKTAKEEKYNEQNCTKDFGRIYPENYHASLRFTPRSELTMRRSELVPEGDLTVICMMKSSMSAESAMKLLLAKLDELKLNYNQALQDKAEAQTKLEVLTNNFKDKEIELQRQLSAKEADRQKKEDDFNSAKKRIIFIEQENASYQSQIAMLKQKMEELERTLKSRIAAQEKKADESKIAAERNLENMEQEVSQLRQRLTLLEREQENWADAARDEIVRPVPKKHVWKHGPRQWKKDILSASCECAGGAAPSGCKHVFAVLSLLQEYCTKELHYAPTDVIQKWHAPSNKRKFKAEKIADMFPSKSATLATYDTSVNFDALDMFPSWTPIFSVINDTRFDFVNFVMKKSIPLPSVVLIEKYDHIYPLNLCASDLFFFNENIKKNLAECYDIECRTMMQNDEFWKNQRLLRVTASNFHKVCKSTNIDDTSRTLLKLLDLSNIPAVAHGKRFEKEGKIIVAQMYSEYHFRDVGLVINPLFPYLGASPDGLLYGENPMLLEIKCLHNINKLSLSELCKNSNFCLKNDDGKYSLKESHKYYYQVQGQMAVCNLTTCLFVVFHDMKEKPFVQKILFDKKLWQDMFAKLKSFYFNIHLKNIKEISNSSVIVNN